MSSGKGAVGCNVRRPREKQVCLCGRCASNYLSGVQIDGRCDLCELIALMERRHNGEIDVIREVRTFLAMHQLDGDDVDEIADLIQRREREIESLEAKLRSIVAESRRKPE